MDKNDKALSQAHDAWLEPPDDEPDEDEQDDEPDEPDNEAEIDDYNADNGTDY